MHAGNALQGICERRSFALLAFSKKTYFNHRLLEKDGSLMCTTGSGMSPCTATHLTDLKQAYSRVNSELEQATTESDRRIHGTVNVYPQK